MDGAHVLYSKRDVSSNDFTSAIATLMDSYDRTAVLLSTRRKLEESLGEPLVYHQDTFRGRQREKPNGPIFNSIELFLDDASQSLLYIANSPFNSLSGPGSMEARRQLEHSIGTNMSTTGIIIGSVGPQSDQLAGLAESLCSDFENALRASIDGRRARHMTFTWTLLRVAGGKPKSAGFSHLAETDEDLGVRFTSPANLDDGTLDRVRVIADPAARILLREIAESGFARHLDLLGRRGKRKEEFENALQKVKDGGLVEIEYLIQCKKTSAQLVRVKEVDSLSDNSMSILTCTNCNRSFADEVISEGYKLSDEGRTLTQGSHWMTIWVTRSLLDLGVDPESILWNVEDSGEEVDLMIEHAERIWIFELKDREFGAGDAYPFNYRKARYRANEAVVITTDKVASDARRVFDDLAKRRKPHLVEGLDNLQEVLSNAFKQAGSEAAKEALVVPSAISGLDLKNWYNNRNS